MREVQVVAPNPLPSTPSIPQSRCIDQPPATHGRVFEHGILKTREPHDFIFCFETEPFWLLALHSNFVLSLMIDNSANDNFSEFH